MQHRLPVIAAVLVLLTVALFAGEPEQRQEKSPALTPKTPAKSLAHVPYMTLTIYAGDDHLTASFGWLAGLPDSITVAIDDTERVTYVRRDSTAAAP